MTPIETLGLSRRRPAPAAAGGTRSGDRLLLWAAGFFTVAVLVHGADHLRRGVDSIGRDVFWLGTAAMVVEVGVVVLACQRHRRAPLAAAVAGLSLALGYLAVHFLPSRSWLSDSFTGAAGVSSLSWIAASLETVASLALGVAGLVVLRRRGGLVAAAADRDHRPLDLRQGLLHPIALVMLVGNMVLLAVSVTQLA